MKFKDVYKSANDKLSPDRSAIDELFEKQEKKRFYSYKYASLCAAAAILVLIIASYDFNTPKQEMLPDREKNVYSTKQNQKTEDGSADTSSEKSMSNPVSSGAGAMDSYIFSDANRAATPKDDLENNALMKRTSPAVAESSLCFDESEKDDNIVTEVLSKEEYLEYLGINPVAALSNGMKIVSSSEFNVLKDSKSGEIVDDSAVFTLYSEEEMQKNIVITVGKVSPKPNLDGEIKVVDGVNVHIVQSESAIYAYFTKDDVWVYVVATGISSGEFEDFLLDVLDIK